MNIINDYQNKQVFGNVNFVEEGMPWTKVQGRYRILYVFSDPSFCNENMVAIADGQRDENDPIFVPLSSVKIEEETNTRKIDLVSFIQGAHDARDAGKITPELHEAFSKAVYPLRKYSTCGRSYVKYGELLNAISKVDADWWQLAGLWECIGKSMASGLSVGDQLKSREEDK